MQGAEFSGARRLTFPHNDWRALNDMLTRLRGRHRRALVVIEGVYSADGDIPDLARFVEVKSRHHAMLMVDEAHSLGVLGATGRGVAEHAGVDPREVDIWMGTLSKSLASCGGYIAGSTELVEYLKYTSPAFVYSVGMTPANAAAALAALRKLQGEPGRVARLRSRAVMLRSMFAEAGFPIPPGEPTPVIPIVVGDAASALRLSSVSARQQSIDVQPMVPPAVPEQQSRLRFFVTSEHTDADLRAATGALSNAFDCRVGLRRRHAQRNPDERHDPRGFLAARTEALRRHSLSPLQRRRPSAVGRTAPGIRVRRAQR